MEFTASQLIAIEKACTLQAQFYLEHAYHPYSERLRCAQELTDIATQIRRDLRLRVKTARRCASRED